MSTTPSGERLHIALFGRRNAGKSSLLNALTGQQVALVSPIPGTTTDPVNRPMELLPIGPVVLVDTAGLDDEGELGSLRVERSLAVLDRADMAIVVLDAGAGVSPFEDALIDELKRRKIPTVGAVNKADLHHGAALGLTAALTAQYDLPFVSCHAAREGVTALRQAIIAHAPAGRQTGGPLAGLVKPGDLVVLVTPIDSAAPKGRMILPQVEAIRDILDQDAFTVVVKEHQLEAALASLGRKPSLVVTDSQVFGLVDKIVPQEIPLTSFSILLARFKGDLPELVRGARALDQLKPGDRVLVAETCTHHQQPDDIGTVKIPNWLRKRVGGELDFTWANGKDMPADLSQYDLVIHCGGCMINRSLMMTRIRRAQAAEVPIVNYGVCIAHLHGILHRALSPFPELEAVTV